MNKSFTFFLFFFAHHLIAQTAQLTGKIVAENEPLGFANIMLKGTQLGATTDENGVFVITKIPEGKHKVIISYVGYKNFEKTITLKSGEIATMDFDLTGFSNTLDEVVISGTMKEVSKMESAVPIEIYNKNFFRANPTPSIFESLQNINGIRPQLNCNVCNTGDIHINGLEGPYTMIMIDGMPIVSGLSTVYGLTGIPQSLIERIEIVKGPASTLYGSEAVGGLVNIITKKPKNAPTLSADIFSSHWADVNTDLGLKFNVKEKAQSLVGINYFNYQNPLDINKDGFTDITLQNRLSVFNKWNFERKDNKVFSMAGRYVYENRWGGQTTWNNSYRGGDEVYGESIYTKRWELFGVYDLPVKEKISFQWSGNGHNQDSYYGNVPFNAQQYIAFGQFLWDKKVKKHDMLLGAAFRYTHYDDNTPATSEFDTLNTPANRPSITRLPGVFFQDEINFNAQNKLLIGIRYDYNSIHGGVFSPRLNYKWSSQNKKNVLRLSVGNGYRVANIFTEDHAALTGARKVEFTEALRPETSWNGNLNFVKKVFLPTGGLIAFDFSAFYTHFQNRIIPDYETDPNKIIYNNLNGNAVSKGISLNTNLEFNNGLKMILGGTLMEVNFTENNVTTRQLLTEGYSGVWSIGYTFKNTGWSLDYTGNLYGPMRLPLLSDLDDRPEFSPIWSLQNLQATKSISNGVEIYFGIKNILNFTPPTNSIARAFDPFDKQVTFGANGQVVPTPDNPRALSFDPTYVFAPNQGIRGFAGFRYTFKK
jgi:outer membrane receptor for ferrienterochelin and colicins